ncbi:hypothetical protein PTKIN_Ptkin07bG0090600 [Pterospermum kingtungense]
MDMEKQMQNMSLSDEECEDLNLEIGDTPQLVYDLSTGLMSVHIGQQIGNFIGRFLAYDEKNNSEIWQSYMRITVSVDVRKPLKRKKSIKKRDGGNVGDGRGNDEASRSSGYGVTQKVNSSIFLERGQNSRDGGKSGGNYCDLNPQQDLVKNAVVDLSAEVANEDIDLILAEDQKRRRSGPTIKA